MRARRVRRRKIERVEVVVRRLDLAPVDDPVAKAQEDVLDLAAHLRDEVQLAARHRLPGKSDVHLLLDEATLELLARKRRFALLDGTFELLPERVQDPARLGVTNLPESLFQRALPTEVANPRIIELAKGRSARNRALRLSFQALDVHRRSVSSWKC